MLQRAPLHEVPVDHRELTDDDPDRFRHSDIVLQVVDLVTGVGPPANVALYGPWGSGKSSLANHLEAALSRH